MVDGITDFLEDNRSVAKELVGDICSVSLELAGKAGASKLVSPAIWVLTGEAPDSVDLGLWGMGLAGGLVGLAGMATGALKAVIDDDVNRRVRAIQQVEGQPYSEFIKSTLKFGVAGATINAQNVARSGGTTWFAHDVWVYITDAKGRLVCDYQPKIAQTILQPLLPLRPTGDGGFRWATKRG